MNKIAVIGIGRLGLCFALNLERAGYEVLGVDVNESYLDEIRNKTLRSGEPQLEDYLRQSSRLSVHSDLSVIESADIQLIFILVPTPSLESGRFSHAYIDEVVESLLQGPKPNTQKHLIIGCTTMPGYCDSIAARLAAHNYTVSYNPEFIAQGSIIRDQQNPDQILIGEGAPEATSALVDIYRKMCVSKPGIHVMSRKSAELSKLATNCYLTMKISFANAIGDLALSVGTDPGDILNAIGSDSRIGNKYLKYGYGFGGPCFPRDNQALTVFAADAGQPLHLSKATIQVNESHLDYQLNQLLEEGKDTYVFDSVTYKEGTDILEESQQLKLAVKLAEAGRKVQVRNSENVRAELETRFPGYFEFI